jgi:hypothetical protein
MKISEHITLAEAIHSNTAKRCGIDNLPNEEQTNNMKMLAEKIFEPLRLWVGGPIKINSMFRSEKLNKAIGGASSSQHCKGLAMTSMDIKLMQRCTNGYVATVISIKSYGNLVMTKTQHGYTLVT